MSHENVERLRQGLDAFNRRDLAMCDPTLENVPPRDWPESDTTRGREASYWQVATFRNGKILRMEWFADRAEALEAVGLRE
jgi:hypothetical protein